MKTFFLFFAILVIAIPAWPQDFDFFGEGHADHVKLLWVPKNWPSGLSAFQVKRRPILNNQKGAWTNVNATPVFPEMSRAKDLGNVDSDPARQNRLRNKLEGFLSSGKAKEISRQSYLQKLSSDKDAVKGLYIPIALDYDFALLNGFALVDRNPPSSQAFEYGLFLIIGNSEQGQPVGTFDWNYGDGPDLDMAVDLKIYPVGGSSELEARWTFDYNIYKNKNINGFNIYRQQGNGAFAKLNEAPLWATTTSTASQLSFFDDTAQPFTVYTYAVAPQSLFGTEGPRTEAVFNPADQPVGVLPPALQVSPQNTDSQPEILFEWDFDSQKQSFIRGFVLQRRMNIEDAYENVSPDLPPSARSFSDTPPTEGEYYLYQLKVLDDFDLNLSSNELLLFYQPMIPPPVPTGLTGVYEKSGNQQIIHLRWDANTGTATAGYQIYSNFPPDEDLLMEGNIPLITTNNYRYEITGSKSELYRFAISAVSESGAESSLSNIAEVTTASAKLPNTNIWPFSVNGNQITLNWEYDAPPDLAGFRVFQDDVLVADENVLDKNQREWTSPPLEYNATYNFVLQAVTVNGVESRKSIARTITTGKEQ